MSAIMLDTCGLIWLVNGGGKLSKKTLKAIQDANIVYVSAATALEIGCKTALGKLELPASTFEWYTNVLNAYDLVEIPINGEIAMLSATLPFIHKDPADRIIIATAKLKHLSVVTHDSRFESYSITVLR